MRRGKGGRILIFDTIFTNRESPAQFENRIRPRVYGRRITHGRSYHTQYEKASSVAYGFSPIKIHFSDYPKS